MNEINGSLRARRLPEDAVDAGHDTIRLPPLPLFDRSIPVSFILADKDAVRALGALAHITRQLVTRYIRRLSRRAENDQRYVRYLDSGVESKQLWLARKLPFLDLRARAFFLNLSLYDGRGRGRGELWKISLYPGFI